MIKRFIAQQMKELDVPYAYWEWVDDVPKTYFVGEYTETSSLSEDGELEGQFTLSGFTRGTWADLDAFKEKIYRRFRNGEKDVINGYGVAVYYNNAMPVPTGLEDVKRLEITLDTKEWSE